MDVDVGITMSCDGAHPKKLVYMLMRDAEGRQKAAGKVKQRMKQSNTAHLRQSLLSCMYNHA